MGKGGRCRKVSERRSRIGVKVGGAEKGVKPGGRLGGKGVSAYKGVKAGEGSYMI